MAPRRVSAGRYDIGGKVVNATSAADAAKMGGRSRTPAKTSSTSTSTRVKAPAQVLPGNFDLSKPTNIVDAQEAINQGTFDANLNANRVNQQSDFGTLQYTKNADGTYTANNKASGANAEILQNGQAGAAMGSRMAGSILSGSYIKPFSLDQVQTQRFGDYNQERSRIEDATYNRLTRGLEDNYKQGLEDKKQELYNRGIPIGSAAYNNEMNRFENQYNNQRQDARAQAVAMGGDQTQQAYNIQSGNRANEIGELQGQSQFGVNLAQQLYGVGIGYQNPNSSYINPTPIERQGTNVTGIGGAAMDAATARDVARINASNRGGGGGGYDGPSFGGGLPPGYVTPTQGGGSSAGSNLVGAAVQGASQGIGNAILNGKSLSVGGNANRGIVAGRNTTGRMY